MSDALTIDRAQVQHIAKLACLSLTSEETDRMAIELDAIVQYINELAALDTEGVPPTADVQLAPSTLRPDEVLTGLTPEDALAQAPRKAHGGFAVPAFVEG